MDVSFPGGGLSLVLRLWPLCSTTKASPSAWLGTYLLAELGEGWVFSHEALRRWLRRAGELLPGRRRRRRVIALEETVVKVVGAEDWLWREVDLGNGGVLASRLSRYRGGVDTCLFLDRVLDCCNKPLAYTDRGPWYAWSLDLYVLRDRVEAFGRRNRVEVWFSRLKARTRRFYNNLPYRSSVESAQS